MTETKWSPGQAVQGAGGALVVFQRDDGVRFTVEVRPDGTVLTDSVGSTFVRLPWPALVAPCLSCQTGLCGEHGPARVETTTGAAVFCDECRVKHRPGENTLCPKTQREAHPAWKEAARMNEWLKPHVAPAPVAETSGEVSPEGLRLALDPFYRQAIYAGMADAVGNREMVNEHADRAEEALKPVFAAWTALRASRDEERARADKAEWKVRHQEGVTATWGREYTKAIDERDEAREQRDAALDRADEVTRDLAAAEAEVASLRGRVAEDNAVCLCGCPADQHEDGDQDGESCGRDDHECLRVAPAVATLFAALRERCRRLEEAGDKMAALGTWPTACGWSLRDAWAAAKGALDAPAAGGGAKA